MESGKVKCRKCEQTSSRNIHNKCIYCGFPFEEKHHATAMERSLKLDEIEATTERLKAGIKQEKERIKKQQEDQAKNRGDFDDGL